MKPTASPVPTSVRSELHVTALQTPVGELRIVASAKGVRAILWEVDTDDDRVRNVDAEEIDPENHVVLRRAVDQLRAYFSGTRREFDLPLDLVGTDFQKQAWLALAAIPYGETTSYKIQAERIGRPAATRAVGAANGKNPLSIVLPCHRVIGSGGALTGFAAGLDMKRWLLDHERAHAGTTLF